jgi:hypothetical protein
MRRQNAAHYLGVDRLWWISTQTFQVEPEAITPPSPDTTLGFCAVLLAA